MYSAPRRVLVTGGSSGIGAEIVRQFLAEGDEVTIFDRSAPSDPRCPFVLGDVTSTTDQQRAVAAAARSGRLDVLIANAGVHDGGRRLVDGDIDDLVKAFRHVLDVNVVGYLLSLRAAADPLRAARGCAVLTLSDASFGVMGNGAGVAYATAKHAALGLLRAAARDLAPDVRVNAVAPGGVATGLGAEDGTTTSRRIITDPDRLAAALREKTALRRGARLEHIAAAYLYLASPAAGSMTGQVLRVDGGLLA